MKKDILKIDRYKLQRSFFGTHNETNPTHEAWSESGHYYQGVDFLAKRIREKDGKARDGGSLVGYDPLGYIVSGSGEPAQNDDEAIAFYKYVMNGTRNAAFLIGKKLWLFRLVNPSGVLWQDNRIAIATDLHYSMKLKGQTEFSGYVPDYEVYTVDPNSVKVVSGKLQFKIVGVDPKSYQAQFLPNNNF